MSHTDCQNPQSCNLSLPVINQPKTRKTQKTALFVIYHSPHSFYLIFQTFLSELVLSFDKIIIMHDFNTHIDGENESLDINVIFY